MIKPHSKNDALALRLLLFTIIMMALVVPFASAISGEVNLRYVTGQTGDTLRCDFSLNQQEEIYRFTDVEYAWYENNTDTELQPFSEEDTYTCPSNCDDDRYYLCVVRFSNDTWSDELTSRRFKFLNAPPVITNISIEPAYPSDRNILTCSVNEIEDVDSPQENLLVISYLWEYRSSDVGSWIFVNESSNQITPDFTSVGEEWRCTATVSDFHKQVDATVTTYIHSLNELPSAHSGNPNGLATVNWQVNYGTPKTEVERISAIRKDELRTVYPLRPQESFVFLKTTCLDGECGNLEHTYYYPNATNSSELFTIPTDPLLIYRTGFLSLTDNPQSQSATYPNFPQQVPTLKDTLFYEATSCLGYSTSLNENASCTYPILLEESETYSTRNQGGDGSLKLSVASCATGDPRLSSNVQCEPEQVSARLAVQTTGACERYNQLQVFPGDYVTTEGDELKMFTFAYDTVADKWDDVTHKALLLSSHQDYVAVNDTDDFTIHMRQPTAALPAGQASVTVLYCGNQEVVAFTVEEKNPACRLGEVNSIPNLLQYTFDSTGSVRVEDRRTGGPFPLIGDVTNNDETQFTVLDTSVIKFGTDAGSTNKGYYQFTNQSECDPRLRPCATHVKITTDDPTNACGADDVQRTISVRTNPDFCSNSQVCEDIDPHSWVNEYLILMFGPYAEWLTPSIRQDVIDEINVLADFVKNEPRFYELYQPGTTESFRSVLCGVDEDLGQYAINPDICTYDFFTSFIYADFDYDTYRNNPAMRSDIIKNLTSNVINAQSLTVTFFENTTTGNLTFNLNTQTCPTDENNVAYSATACQRCISYGGLEYQDGALHDVDFDGSRELCEVDFTTNTSIWRHDEAYDRSACGAPASIDYQECSEEGSTYVPDNTLLYTFTEIATQNYGAWCAFDEAQGRFDWVVGPDSLGTNLSDLPSFRSEGICTDGRDSDCNMYNAFSQTSPGIYDLTNYLENNKSYEVASNSDNLDRFDSQCWSTLNVTVINASNRVPLDDIDVQLFFRRTAPGSDENRLYREGRTDVNGFFEFNGALPATSYFIRATKDSTCVQDIPVDLEVLESRNVTLELLCGTRCGNGIVDAGEQCEYVESNGILGQQPDEIITLTGGACPLGQDPTNMFCNNCQLEGSCQRNLLTGDIECPDGNVVIVRRPVTDPVTGDRVTLSIASCQEN